MDLKVPQEACGKRERGEGWYYRVEEGGEGERGGATVLRKRERGTHHVEKE